MIEIVGFVCAMAGAPKARPVTILAATKNLFMIVLSKWTCGSPRNV
jgi:hypothetical protein